MNASADRPDIPVLIGLGSNIEPEKNIQAALDLLGKHTKIVKQSSIWQTPAVGSSGPDYLNAAALVKTSLPLENLKSDLLAGIESSLGRIRSADKYMDRTIDLDVLIYNNIEVDPELWSQAHIAVPASELCPDFINTETGEELSSAAARLSKGRNLRKRRSLPRSSRS